MKIDWNNYKTWQVYTLHLMFLIPAVLCITVSFILNVDDLERGTTFIPPCQIKKNLGVECMSCGMTRGFTSISHGEIRQAVNYNKLSLLYYIGFVILAFGASISLKNYINLKRESINERE